MSHSPPQPKHTCQDVKQFYLLLIKGLIFHQISGVFSEKACYAKTYGGNPRFAKFTEPWLVKMTGSASSKEGCSQDGRWMIVGGGRVLEKVDLGGKMQNLQSLSRAAAAAAAHCALICTLAASEQ